MRLKHNWREEALFRNESQVEGRGGGERQKRKLDFGVRSGVNTCGALESWQEVSEARRRASRILRNVIAG